MARMLIIAQTKCIDMRMVLSYSLSPVSMPLTSTDGSLAKTNKADLLHGLESSVSDCLEVDVPQGALMVDCMAILQSMPHNFDTFGQFADAVLKRVIGLVHRFHTHRIDVVSDTYPAISIKNMRDLAVVLVVNRIFAFSTKIRNYLLNGRSSLPMGKTRKTLWNSSLSTGLVLQVLFSLTLFCILHMDLLVID